MKYFLRLEKIPEMLRRDEVYSYSYFDIDNCSFNPSNQVHWGKIEKMFDSDRLSVIKRTHKCRGVIWDTEQWDNLWDKIESEDWVKPCIIESNDDLTEAVIYPCVKFTLDLSSRVNSSVVCDFEIVNEPEKLQYDSDYFSRDDFFKQCRLK